MLGKKGRVLLIYLSSVTKLITILWLFKKSECKKTSFIYYLFLRRLADEDNSKQRVSISKCSVCRIEIEKDFH